MLQRLLMRRFGARLGLFALALQLVLSFGHIHPADIFRFGHPVLQGTGTAELIAARDASPMGPLLPGQVPGSQLECAICVSMTLAGSLLTAEPPALAPPPTARAAPTRGERPLHLAAAPYRLFQTRAPPSA